MKTLAIIAIVFGVICLIGLLIAFPIVYFYEVSNEVEEPEGAEAEPVDDQLDK